MLVEEKSGGGVSPWVDESDSSYDTLLFSDQFT